MFPFVVAVLKIFMKIINYELKQTNKQLIIMLIGTVIMVAFS